jgi:prephenate dehydrogenase
MRLGVLGVGLIGGSIGLAAGRRLEAEVVGYDPDPGTAERALAAGAIAEAAPSAAAASAGADVVFCAAPVGALAELAREALAAAARRRVVTDVGSTKREIVAALGADERFIGGHPLAGAETAGVENARADLFEGARWYLTPTEPLRRPPLRPPAADRRRPRRPAAGDRRRDARPLMATVSHLPHVLANALVARRRRSSPRLRAAARGRPELPRHDPRRRLQPGDLGRHLRQQPRGGRRLGRRVARRLARRAS